MPSSSWEKELEEHRELLRPLEPLKQPSQAQKIMKRILTLGIALLLLLLLLVYFVPGYDLLSILEGKTVSDVVDNYRITLADGRVILFNPDVYAQLRQLYLDNQHQEFSACLLGLKQDNIYSLTRLVQPKTYEQDIFHVRAEMCMKETLIALHSHPYKHCIFSEADIQYYNAFAKLNKEGLIGVMCELDRFGFYP